MSRSVQGCPRVSKGVQEVSKRCPRSVQMKWFKFFPSDWLSDSKVQSLSLEYQGAYIRILCYMWKDSEDATILADPTFLRPLLGVSGQKIKKMLKFFSESEISPLKKVVKNEVVFLQSERLLREKDEAASSHNKKRLAGQKGAASRWKDKEKEAWQPHDSANGKTWQFKNLELRTKKKTKDKEHSIASQPPPEERFQPPRSTAPQEEGAKKIGGGEGRKPEPEKTPPPDKSLADTGSLRGQKLTELVLHSDCPNKIETVEMWARRWHAKGIPQNEIIRTFQAHPGSTVIDVDKILTQKFTNSASDAQSIQNLIRDAIEPHRPK